MPLMESTSVVIDDLGRGVRQVETKVRNVDTLLIILPAADEDLEGVSR